MTKKDRGDCLRDFREKMGFRQQADFANEINRKGILASDTPEVTVNRWERGQRAPSIKILTQLAEMATDRGYTLFGGEDIASLLKDLYTGVIESKDEWIRRSHLHMPGGHLQDYSEHGGPIIEHHETSASWTIPGNGTWAWVTSPESSEPLAAFYCPRGRPITLILRKPLLLQQNMTDGLEGPVFKEMAAWIRPRYKSTAKRGRDSHGTT